MSNQPRFSHVIGRRHKYSVAYNFTNNDGVLTINYGIAQCNRADNFNRAEGRRIAAARLNKATKPPKAPVEDTRSSIMYGSFTAVDNKDKPVNVSRLIKERFEAARRNVLAEHSAQYEARLAMAEQALRRAFADADIDLLD